MDRELLLWVVGGLGLAVLFIAGLLVFAGAPADTAPVQEPSPLQPTTGLRTVSSGEFSATDAQFELTPRGVVDGMLVVDFRANTHGIPLSDYDLAEVATLSYDGLSVKPVRASPMRTHHNSGTIEFPVEGEPEAFTITISGVPAIEERVFSWGGS